MCCLFCMLFSGTESSPGSCLPSSQVVPNLPGCVLAPLSSNDSLTLLQIFTGESSQTDPWKTW